jgi:aminopeptidase N
MPPRQRLRCALSAVAALSLAACAASVPPPRTPVVEPAEPRQILPVTLVPSHYALAVDPDAESLRFKAQVSISGDAPRAGRQIVLNAKGLTLDEVDLDGTSAAAMTVDATLNRATLTFAAPFERGPHVLHIAYHGAITQGTVGFFAMDYDSPAGKRRTLATNFEPAEARQLLPCWDEPGLKATFAVSVDAAPDRLVVSNMPVQSREPLPDGRERVTFHDSPRMSTYLLFLGVGDYERIHREVDGVDVGVVFKRGDAAKAAYALDQAALVLHFYDDYFGIRFPLPKLDLVAAPGSITGGSMENWGSIFFSQEHVLFDPAASTERERQRVFLVVAHEMAHQWFGDLVTMSWWDGLWLNEGFARWMQTHAADALHPEWQTGLQAANIFEAGKRADAQPSTHPVLQPVLSAEQATQAFDEITYDKGAAVITMLEAYVGADSFREGVRRYMRAHAFGNTVDADLWTQIASASGKPVLDIEHDFTLQTGVPLIRVQPAGAGFRLVEGRFAEDPDSLAGESSRSWRLPLSIGDAQGHVSETLLSGSFDVSGASPLVNAGALGYARVAYPEPLARALAERMGGLQPADQINLMNDAWALGQSGYAPARNLLVFMSALPADANPVVWRRAVDLLETLDRAYGHMSEGAAFRQAARQLLAPLQVHLGAFAAGETANVTTLRSRVWSAEARFGDPAALEHARRLFASGDGSIADRRTALQIVAAAADSALFDQLLQRVRAAQDPQAKARLLEAMGGARDPALSARMVDVAFGPDVPAGSAASLLYGASLENPDAVWEALRPYLAKGPLPIDPQTRWFVVPGIAGLSADPLRIADIRRYGEQDMPADARRPIDSAVSSIKLNQRVRSGALPDISAWVAAQAAPQSSRHGMPSKGVLTINGNRRGIAPPPGRPSA